MGFARGEHPVTHWPLMRGGQLRVEASLACNEPTVLREAALRGRGIALLAATLVLDDLAGGALVAVLPERIGAEARVAVVYPERELVPAAVRAFVDAAVAWARDEPALSRPLPPCPPREAAARPRAGR